MKGLRLPKELYKTNPHNVSFLGGLNISYYKLAMVPKSTGNDRKRNISPKWKHIISHLAKNLPQVAKYREWDQVEY